MQMLAVNLHLPPWGASQEDINKAAAYYYGFEEGNWCRKQFSL